MNNQKIALITGVTGQDGSYLAELLLSKGYAVHGLVRRTSLHNTSRVDHLLAGKNKNEDFYLHYGDLSDSGALRNILDKVRPNEVYNLGAQSHVGVSFEQPEYTADVTGVGVVRLLDAIRSFQGNSGDTVRFYQAGSSEMFGSAPPRQHEGTVFQPRSPYACAKAYAHYQVKNYRESYGIFAANGILFNHESPRRGENFVTRKITRAATRIKLGLQDKLYLGNIEAKRDWGFAGDYVEAMWLMLQHNEPDDFCVARGESIKVSDFLVLVFEHLDLDWNEYVEIDASNFRPAEVTHLEGDSTKIREVLGWEPKHDIHDLVNMMTSEDMKIALRESDK